MRARPPCTERRRRLAAATLLALALTTAASTSRADEVETLSRENARLTARVRELEAELAALRGGVPAASAADPAAPAGPGVRFEPVYVPRSRVSLEVTPDEATGETTVATLWYRTADLGLLPRKEWLQLRARQGTDGGFENVWLLVERQGSAGGAKPSTGKLTIDGAAVELPVDDYEVKRRNQSIGPASASTRDERVRFTVPVAVLAQVAAARKARFDAGAIEFDLTDEHLAAFAAMAARAGGAPAAQAGPAAAPVLR